MKKLVMLLIASIILSTYVSALIQIDGPSRNIYNLGDKFPISGSVLEESQVSGFLRMAVKCGDKEFPLQLVPISLSAGEKKTFQELGVPQITISASMNGNCIITTYVSTTNQTLSATQSKTFLITKNLEGSFTVEEPRVQVGSAIDIIGTLLKMDGSGVDGVAEVYFSQGGQKFLVDTVAFQDGIFNYTSQTKAIPSGAYTIDVIARDVFGNEMAFTNAASFFLSNKLEIKLKSDKAAALPGETITLTGNVRTVLNKAPEGATLDILLDTMRTPVTLKDGNFELELKLPVNLKSGKHTLVATATDNIGNSGSNGVNLEVTSVATTLSLTADKQNYLPNDQLGITTNLHDQGSDLIDTLVNLRIINPKNEEVTATEIETNKQEKFMIPMFAMPGKWKMAANIKTLSTESSFEIAEVNSLEAMVNGETLYLTNTGNIKHKGRIIASISDGKEEYKASAYKSLLPNETLSIDLTKYAPNGEYTVTVQLPQKTAKLNVKIINGKKLFNLNILFALLVAALAFVLLYMALLKPQPRHKFMRESKLEPKIKFKKRIRSEEPAQKSSYDDVADFKSRILRDIKKTEEQMSKPFKQKRGGFGLGSENNPDGSPFANMFG